MQAVLLPEPLAARLLRERQEQQHRVQHPHKPPLPQQQEELWQQQQRDGGGRRQAWADQRAQLLQQRHWEWEQHQQQMELAAMEAEAQAAEEASAEGTASPDCPWRPSALLDPLGLPPSPVQPSWPTAAPPPPNTRRPLSPTPLPWLQDASGQWVFTNAGGKMEGPFTLQELRGMFQRCVQSGPVGQCVLDFCMRRGCTCTCTALRCAAPHRFKPPHAAAARLLHCVC